MKCVSFLFLQCLGFSRWLRFMRSENYLLNGSLLFLGTLICSNSFGIKFSQKLDCNVPRIPAVTRNSPIKSTSPESCNFFVFSSRILHFIRRCSPLNQHPVHGCSRKGENNSVNLLKICFPHRERLMADYLNHLELFR